MPRGLGHATRIFKCATQRITDLAKSTEPPFLGSFHSGGIVEAVTHRLALPKNTGRLSFALSQTVRT